MAKYHRETDLQLLTQDELDEILDMALNLSDELEFIDRPWRQIAYDSTQKDIERVTGDTRVAREFYRRRLIMARELGFHQTGVKEMVIDQYRLPPRIHKPLATKVSEMFDISMNEIDPIIQIQNEGHILYPHIGHARNSSIFCLLQSNNERTIWYEETEPFKTYSMYRIPDYSKLKEAEETKLTVGKWTTFMHNQWHAVKRDGDPKKWRVNLNIDFASLPYHELLEKIDKWQKST